MAQKLLAGKEQYYTPPIVAVDSDGTCFQGNFNLNNLPESPERSDSFTFLAAATDPSKEVERHSICRKYDILWEHEFERYKVGQHLQHALENFGVSGGAVSFFDERYEIAQISITGYASEIDRNISIAAHALCSPDVMVVLDTKKVCAALFGPGS
jgi:hypothetical protein